MPNISKEQTEQAIYALEYGIRPQELDAIAMLQGLLAQPEGEPVAIYQYQMANGSWIDQDKQSYDYNVRHGEANVRIVYTHPAPFVPITADMVTESVRNAFLSKDVLDEALATAFNAYMGAKK